MSATPGRGRLRFESLSYEPYPDGSSRVSVALEWMGMLHWGKATGTGTMEGDLRASAEAALAAAEAATGGTVSLSLLGIKAVRAFDSRVVIAAVDARAAGQHVKLLGAHAVAEGDLPRAATLTVLDAVNRFLGRLISHKRAAAGVDQAEADYEED